MLGALDDQVAKKFEAGEAQAKAAFTADHQARMKRYKDERYDGLTGAARWAYDLFADLPAEANNLFLEAKKVYEAKMQGVIGDIDTDEPEPEPVTDENATLRKLVSWPTLGSIDYAGPEGMVTVSYSDSREQGPISCIVVSALGRAVDRTGSIPRYQKLGADLHEKLGATRTVMDWGIEMRGFSCEEEVDRLRAGRFEGTYSLLDLRAR